MTDEIPELSVPARHSFSDPNTALKFRDLLKEFADGIVQDSTVKDRYGYILDITQTGPEYPSSVIEITDETDAYGNPIDPVLAPNSIDNPERASYATVLTDDGFRIRARIAPSQIPAFRKAEFFDKFDPSGYGVMIDERGVYVNVVIEGGLSKIHPSSFPWLLDQGGEKVVVEPQVAPRVWVSGKAGQYYVVSVIRGETPSRIEYEYSKQDILKNIADIQEARFDLDQGAADLVQAQLEIEAAQQDIMDSQTSIIGAVNEATLARAEAAAAFGQSSQATQDAQDAWDEAVAAQGTATTALTSANGSNAIIQSTDTASGTTHPTTGAALKTGDWWQQWDDTTTRNVIGLWRWSGSDWQAQTIAHQVISSLDVNKLVVSGAARITLAVIEKLVADVGFYQVLTTDVLYAGTANVDTLVAQKFATALADIITARVENLTVTAGANINSAVIQKIATELIVAEVLSTGIDPVTGWYAIMDSSGFRVIDSAGANEGAPEVLIHLGPDADQLIQLGTGQNKVSINSSGGGSFRRIDTQEFRLNGANLERLLESYPRGIVAFGQIPYGLSTVQRQGRAIILGVDANLTKGRVYTIRTNQMSLSRGASGVRPIPQLHMTLNGTDPSLDWNGTAVAESPGIVNVQTQSIAHPPMEALIDLRNLLDDGNRVLCRIAVTLNDQNNVSWSQLSTGRGAFHCIVRDEGTSLTDTGLAWLSNNQQPPPAKTRYTKRYYANAIATYVRGGSRDDSSGAVQGKYSSWNRETFLFFPSMTSDLSGATIHSIKAFAWFDHWYNNAGGTGSWCWHGHTSVPSSGQYANYMRDEPNWARNSGREASIIPGEFSAWQNGTRRGIAFSTSNTSLEYYGKLSTNLNAHWIDVEYSK